MLETRRVLKALTESRVALAKLDQAADLMADPTVLINTIPLLEAQASSAIENIVTTADALFRYAQMDDEPSDPAVKETLRYRAALRSGFENMNRRALTAGTAVEVCSEVQGRQMDIRTLRGTRIANPATGRIIYSPPEGADVIRGKLSNWESFTHASDDLDPIVRMAVAHYQFEAIHPFSDGNGRTGRILNILTLIEAGTLRQPILYLSRYIIRHKNEYYRLLNAVTAERAWEEWILYMTEAVRQSATWTTAKIRAIQDLRQEFAVTTHGVTPGLTNAHFLSVLFAQPYCRIGNVMDRCEVSRPTATSWLNALVAAGALVDMKVGRDRLFLNRPFLELLADYD